MSDKISLSSSLEEAIEKFNQFGTIDPYTEIEPSLLNSADILDYVAKTGMIYPFDESCLKPASYGVKLSGEYVYWDNPTSTPIEGRLENIIEIDSDGDKVFNLKRNSIAFVGLEPEFRFPNYIAARFNLKIKHIYQGLLLGTGPLVDPGHQGKIYIPLHNLTNNEYKIKINKTLIWMEFTKLSSHKSWNENYLPNSDRIGQYKPFDITKINQKRNLKAYLNEAHSGPILSTIQGIQSEIDTNLSETKKQNNDAAKATSAFNRAVLISILSVTIAIIVTIYQTITIHNKTLDYLREADKRQIDENSKIINQESTILDLKREVIELKDQLRKKSLIK